MPKPNPSPPPDPLIELGDNLYVHRGAINVGILRDGNRALLIDYGDGDIASSLRRLGISQIDTVLITHYHRDQASGLTPPAEPTGRPGRIIAPARERACLEDVGAFWRDPARRWHLYDFRPSTLMLAQPLQIDQGCQEGDRLDWGSWQIPVINTPGHTDGSVSYLVQGGDRRAVFCGDVIYGPGQIWDGYSLQQGGHFGERTIRDYHGFLGARTALAHSLERLRGARADALVPSHGVIMNQPIAAIDALLKNLNAAYESYAAIAALRYYFPEMFPEFADRRGFLLASDGIAPPPFIHHLGTTWILVSQTGAALVMDCGARSVIEGIQKLRASGTFDVVDAFWISHYHDDHVDEAPLFQETFPCVTIAEEHVAAIITEPRAYQLPCLSPATVRVDRSVRSGESWDWHEFRLTAYHFPGQTLYHGALLVEGRGSRQFFIGDSFTPCGIDDYCAGNRNLLGTGRGFEACLQLVEDLRPDFLFNCHVDPAFTFTPEQIRFMRENLTARRSSFQQLLPWDDPNYGLDEHWVRVYPYEQDISPGQTAALSVEITNHSAVDQPAACALAAPPGWRTEPVGPAIILAQEDGAIPLTISVPLDASAGRYVIPISVTYAGRRLGQFREAILVVG